jgi:hypothetical protein
MSSLQNFFWPIIRPALIHQLQDPRRCTLDLKSQLWNPMIQRSHSRQPATRRSSTVQIKKTRPHTSQIRRTKILPYCARAVAFPAPLDRAHHISQTIQTTPRAPRSLTQSHPRWLRRFPNSPDSLETTTVRPNRTQIHPARFKRATPASRSPLPLPLCSRRAAAAALAVAVVGSAARDGNPNGGPRPQQPPPLHEPQRRLPLRAPLRPVPRRGTCSRCLDLFRSFVGNGPDA